VGIPGRQSVRIMLAPIVLPDGVPYMHSQRETVTMLETFVERKFNADSEELLAQVQAVLDEYAGYKMTLRQVYYQLVTANIIPNNFRSYKNLGNLISNARLAGRLDWNAVEDQVRTLETHSAWTSPRDILESAAYGYAENPWLTQTNRPLFRVEKGAVISVIKPACDRWRVPWMAARGYSSQSEMYDTGKMLARQIAQGLRPIIIYAGDYDPSGQDMTRDTTERLSMFAEDQIEVRRIALNRDQITELGLPPQPAKIATDSRGRGFQALHGDESFELDALKPPYFDKLISDAFEACIDDRAAWDEAIAEEQRHKDALQAAVDRWDEVEEFLARGG
jgi:hypothetical protein